MAITQWPSPSCEYLRSPVRRPQISPAFFFLDLVSTLPLVRTSIGQGARAVWSSQGVHSWVLGGSRRQFPPRNHQWAASGARGPHCCPNNTEALGPLLLLLIGPAQTVAYEGLASSALASELRTNHSLREWRKSERPVFICLCSPVVGLTQGKVE